MHEKEKIIGLLVGGITDPFTRELYHGLTQAAAQHHVRLVLFPGKYIGQKKESSSQFPYEYQYNMLFTYASMARLDGLIVVSGSLGARTDRDTNLAFLDQFPDIPKVLVVADYEGYCTVNYDNESGLREAMEYLISVLGLSRICMLGGSQGNSDAVERRQIYLDCLRQYRIPFEDRYYAAGDMAGESETGAIALLEQNPDAEAIFCVNDIAAMSLYRAMKRRGLTPGRDIRVLGFDNDPLCTQVEPSLASIGADSNQMGRQALLLLLDQLKGLSPSSVKIPTSLTVRQSLTPLGADDTGVAFHHLDLNHIDPLFEEIFYRYKNKEQEREAVNLRRCFREFASRLIQASNDRYVDEDTAAEIVRLIDVFFQNRAMAYTDAECVLNHLTMLQAQIVEQNGPGMGSAILIPFFDRIRDQMILAANRQFIENRQARTRQKNCIRLLLNRRLGLFSPSSSPNDCLELFKGVSELGIRHSFLYLLPHPIRHEVGAPFLLPQNLLLKAVCHAGDCFAIPPERQAKPVADLFSPDDFPSDVQDMVALPIYQEEMLYGLFLCDVTEELFELGDVFVTALGAAIG